MNEDEIELSEQEVQAGEDFDAGFNFDNEQGESGEQAEQQADGNDGGVQETLPAKDEHVADTQQQGYVEQAQGQTYQGQAPQQEPASQPIQQSKRIAFLPNEIEDEYGKLQALNPVAADLAMEDSEAGALVRARLEQYGAEVANDNALLTLNARQQAYSQQMELSKAREAHNRNFAETMKQGVPNYVAMTSDPSRKAEADAYKQEVFGWINQLPYTEAVKMMEVAQSGKDPKQVVALLQRFESERGRKAPQRPRRDPTGALHVPSRGGSVPPASVGEKGDFDAGWRLSEQDDN